MLTDHELATVLAALRFWQRHGPSRSNRLYDRLEADEQTLLKEIQSGANHFWLIRGMSA